MTFEAAPATASLDTIVALKQVSNSMMLGYVGLVVLIDLLALLRLVPSVPVWVHVALTVGLSLVAVAVYYWRFRVVMQHGTHMTQLLHKVVRQHD